MRPELQAYVEATLPAEWRFDERALRWNFRAELDATPTVKVGSSSPEVRQFLSVMVATLSAKRILEIGTSVGHGALTMASSLPDDGALVTIEYDEATHARALANFKAAGADDVITAVRGDAREQIPLLSSVARPWDLVFIDGDKPEYYAYFDAALPFCRPGAVLIADDMNWMKDILGPRYRAHVLAHPRVAYSTKLDIGAGLEITVLKHA